jgi:hypothetical protein
MLKTSAQSLKGLRRTLKAFALGMKGSPQTLKTSWQNRLGSRLRPKSGVIPVGQCLDWSVTIGRNFF